MTKVFPKLCRDCKWSVERDTDYELRCSNPQVNGKDAWALSSPGRHAGTHCRTERNIKWFAACGMKGKRWEAK